MNRHHVAGALASLTAAISALTTATPAAATPVIGFGNAAFDNACANIGGPRAGGATKQHSGIITGLGVALPAGSPGNQCGTLGLPTVLHEEAGVDVVGDLAGGEVRPDGAGRPWRTPRPDAAAALDNGASSCPMNGPRGQPRAGRAPVLVNLHPCARTTRQGLDAATTDNGSPTRSAHGSGRAQPGGRVGHAPAAPVALHPGYRRGRHRCQARVLTLTGLDPVGGVQPCSVAGIPTRVLQLMTWKCRCGPLAAPVAPDQPMIRPCGTQSPVL